MIPQTVERPVEQTTPDDDLDHWFCCDPNRAYCGTDISAHTYAEFAEDSPTMCRVCLDLTYTPCATCGGHP